MQVLGGGIPVTAVAGTIAGGAIGSLAGPVGTVAGAIKDKRDKRGRFSFEVQISHFD